MEWKGKRMSPPQFGLRNWMFYFQVTQSGLAELSCVQTALLDWNTFILQEIHLNLFDCASNTILRQVPASFSHFMRESFYTLFIDLVRKYRPLTESANESLSKKGKSDALKRTVFALFYFFRETQQRDGKEERRRRWSSIWTARYIVDENGDLKNNL